MYLRVKCPNGHALKVPMKFAGRDGVCPVCKEKVKIPPLDKPEVNEDAILDVIGSGPVASTASRYAASRDDLPVHQEESEGQEAEAAADMVADPGDDSSLLKLRKCPQCQRRVPPNFHVCPHCKTYLMEDTKVDQTKATTTCPTCGARSFPGAEVCEQCGTQLFLRG
jgi:ribosomal protein L40E